MMRASLIAPAKTALACALVSVGVLGWAIWFALAASSPPERCTAGLVQNGARCCAPGQASQDRACHGLPLRCPRGMSSSPEPHPGCVAEHRLVSYPGGTLILAPVDWDSENIVRDELSVAPFRLDSHEVTNDRYRRCMDSGQCPKLPLPREPGLPVTGLSAEHAERFCSAFGGRLPSPEEWMFAAMGGSEARRYPWGAHGLNCRRAAYGLVAGPCDRGALGPDLAGARALGASAEGAFDLVGNVAELTRDADGRIFAMGGSFRSRFPAQVKSWTRVSNSGRPEDDLGFRCAYPIHAR